MKKISSRDNVLFRSLAKLAQSARERRKSGLSLLDGPHLIEAYIAAHGAPRSVAVSESGLERDDVQALLVKLAPAGPTVLPDSLFAQLSGVATPVGILACIETPRPAVPATIDSCVVLEDVQDPGNLGSILRSAAAAGIAQVFTSAGCAYAWAPRVLRAAMGAHFLLTIHEHTDLSGLLEKFDGHIVATRASGGTPLFQCELSGKLALLIGNEGAGLSQALLEAADETASIPMPGRAESLNVAAAAAVCLFERVRQMQANSER